MTVQLQLDEKTTLTKLQQDANDTFDIKVLKNLNTVYQNTRIT